MEYKRDKAIVDITDIKEMESVINKNNSCYIAMVDNNKPYLLGFNFAYKDGAIYIHTGRHGKKLDVLKKNNNVCVYFDSDQEIFARHEHVACSWRMRYKSVMIHGTAEILEDYDEKVEGLKIFMKHYSDRDFEFSTPSVNNVNIIKIHIYEMTGRKFEIND